MLPKLLNQDFYNKGEFKTGKTHSRRVTINDPPKDLDIDTDSDPKIGPKTNIKIKVKSRYSMFISGIQQFDPYLELTATQIAAFRQVFDMVDKDGGGSIDADELYNSMKDLEPNLKLDEIKEILEELDQDGNGQIDFEEFLYMMTSMSVQIKEAHNEDSTSKVGRRRQSIFFTVITKFAMKHSLKEIERYYASKARSTPHVVGHYAAGARVAGLSEKELRQTWKDLFLANKGKDSPYAQPLNFVMATRCHKRKDNHKRSKKLPDSPISPSPLYYHSHSRDSSPTSMTFSRCLSSIKSPRPGSNCGWTPRHSLPITKVALPMVKYNRNKNRKKLTIIDMDKIRERVTIARNCYYNQLNVENEEKAMKYRETLKIEEIPSERLQRNFKEVFRAYSPTNEYENHIINENKNKSRKRYRKGKQDDVRRNSRSPILVRL